MPETPTSARRRGAGASSGWPDDAHELPRGWRWQRLRDLSLCEGRYGSPEPAHDHDPGLPRYIRITDVDEHQRLRPDSRASLPWDKAAPHRLHPGDLLFARSGTTVGKTYLYDPGDGVCAHAGYLIRFSLDPHRCEPAYLAQYTRSPAYWSWVARTTRQAAQPNINASEYGALLVPVPPIAEQRRIVGILAAWDRVIAASQDIIDRIVAMKRALVVELLTRGVDWPVATVSELLARSGVAMRSGPFGSELKKRDLATRGVPLLGIDNVASDAFVAEYRRFVSNDTFARLERYAVKPGDVMVTVMGTVGRSCVVPADIGRALSSKHVWTLTFDQSRYLGSLASAQFNHAPWVRAHFRRDEQGGTMAAIRSETLRTTRLPVPPMSEQVRIAQVLERCDRRIAAERAALAKHIIAKRGLMSDLFRARRRVTP